MFPRLFASLVTVLVATAFMRLGMPSSPTQPARTAPVRLSDLTLDRAFSYAVPFSAGTPAPFPELGSSYACSTQFPLTVGAAISEVSGIPNIELGYYSVGGQAVRVRILVNGQARRVFSIPSSHKATDRYEFSPPLIVKPGDTLTIIIPPGSYGNSNVGNNQGVAGNGPVIVSPEVPLEFTIAGWWLLPGEAGN